jgi:hypothetical protein
MEQPAINEHFVRKYLLGELPEEERERLEVRLLTDDSFYEALTALEDEVEDELIDQYLDGELTEPERENFERILRNSPERADKLKLIEDLKARVAVPAAAHQDAPASEIVKTGTRSPQRSWMPAFAFFQRPLVGFSCAVALLLTLLGSGGLLMKTNRLEAELRQAQAREQPSPDTELNLKEQLEQLRTRNEELTNSLRQAEDQRTGLAQELASLKSREVQPAAPPDKTHPTSPRSLVASVILSPAVRGGVGDEKFSPLRLSPGTTQARLVLNVVGVDPRDYKSFRAVVKKSGGGEVWSSDGVKLRTRGNKGRAILTLPAESLTEGQYVVELDAVTSDGLTEPVGIYSFRVTTK